MSQGTMTAASGGAAAGQPARSPDEVLRDIAAERAALEQSFDRLQSEVLQTVEQVKAVGRNALIIGPLAGFAIGGLIVGSMLLGRRRSRTRE
jgi:hypothetical protein